MSAASPFVEFAAGDALLQQGEPARAMYILETGRVEVSRDGVVLGELGPGEFVGEMAILQEQPHSATVTARTAVRALELDQAAFHAVLRANPEVGVQVMRRLVRMLEASEARRAELQVKVAAAGAGPKSEPRPAAGRAGAAPAPDAKPAASPVASPQAAPAVESAPASAPASPAAKPAPAPGPKPEAAPKPAAAEPKPEAAPKPAPAPAPKPKPEPKPEPAPRPAPPPAKPPVAPPAAAPATRAAAAAAPATPTATATAGGAAPGRLALRHGQGRIELEPERNDWRVGRLDPATGQVPEVDLGALDVARSLSRRHARLVREGARLLLSEEPGVVNGTWINGQRLEAGNALPVKPGDRLRFGAVEVELIES